MVSFCRTRWGVDTVWAFVYGLRIVPTDYDRVATQP